MKFKNKKISILGIAKSGKAAAKKLKKLGAKVFLSDSQNMTELKLSNQFVKDFCLETGGHSEKILESDLIIISPGVPSNINILEAARKKNIPIWSELELGFQLIKDRDKTKVIAVTGSNGKSTTASLIYNILKGVTNEIILAGNIGSPLSGFPIDKINYKFIVLEVSSFQLQNINKFKPDISVLLNLTPDHLNVHGTVGNYFKAKSQIFSNQDKDDIAIINANDEEVMKFAYQFPVKKIKYCLNSQLNNYVICRKDFLKISDKFRNNKYLSYKDIPISGQHNVENICAASLVAVYSYIKAEDIRTGIVTFSNLEHRLELVREINDIKFINDSKATNTASVFCSINSFKNPINLIMGGADKDEDFTVLKKMIEKKVKNVVLIGETAPKLREIFSGLTSIYIANTLEEAVNKVYEVAQPKEIVILAPGCASFDMFNNFEDRGEQFKRIVNNLS